MKLNFNEQWIMLMALNAVERSMVENNKDEHNEKLRFIDNSRFCFCMTQNEMNDFRNVLTKINESIKAK